VSACSTANIEDEPYEPDFRPLARYVVETNIFWNFNDYVQSMSDGTFEYDEVVRQPFVPDGPVDIDCLKTHRVGATIFLFNFEPPPETSGQKLHAIPIHSKKLRVSYEWTHSGNTISGGRYYDDVFPDKNGFISTGLILTNKERVEGVLTLTTRYKGDPVYETAFRMNGCEPAN
jgi:hypothetical protein